MQNLGQPSQESSQQGHKEAAVPTRSVSDVCSNLLMWLFLLTALLVNLVRYAQPGEQLAHLEIERDVQSAGKPPVDWQQYPTPVPLPPLDINQANLKDLVALPGIGPSLAQAIVEDRAQYGPFSDLESLDRVPGIGPGRISQLSESVVCGTTENLVGKKIAALKQSASSPVEGKPDDTRLDLNTATHSQLMELPGIGDTYARRIIKRREELGSFSRWDELLAIPGIGAKRLENIQQNARIE